MTSSATIRIQSADNAVVTINCTDLAVVPFRTRPADDDPDDTIIVIDDGQLTHYRLYGVTTDRAELERFSFDHAGSATVYGQSGAGRFMCDIDMVPLGVTNLPGPLTFTFDVLPRFEK